MRNAVLAALALSAAITTQAKADYVWDFTATQATALTANGDYPGGYYPTPGVSHEDALSWVPGFQLVVTNAGFAAGSLTLDWSSCDGGICQVGPTGDIDRIVAFNGLFWNWSGRAPWGSAHIALTWTPDGDLSGTVEYYGDVRDLRMGTADGSWSGWFAADDSECGMGGTVQACNIDSGITEFRGDPPGSSVPEPASFALLGVGLLGAGAARKLTLT